MAAADVLKWNADAGAYDIYEIKMSSTAEEDDAEDGKPAKVNKKRELQFEYDLSFQVNVMEMCGVKINAKYLVRLNKEYKRIGDLDFTPGKLFIIEPKTEAIDRLIPGAKIEMQESYDYLSKSEMPEVPCPCYYKGRNSHCTAFTYINPQVPEYSVHDLNRIGSSKNYLRELLDAGILTLDIVPEDDRLRPKPAKEGEKPRKPRKLNQVRVYKSKEPIIDIPAIKTELDALKFPLYFLDYETSPAAIPPYSGYRPYQHIVFQYSLHVLTEEDAKSGREPQHFECLILEGDPSERVADSLRKHIGNTGSVISWFKAFENSRNRELAFLVPDHSKFLHEVIERTYDLMDIVENQFYVHHGFKGKSSIKKVQQVLAPDFSYKDLVIQNGMGAIEAYRQITTGQMTAEEVEEKRAQMLKYCEYDTKIMYIIWKAFYDLVNK